jgi:hypothetical protein
MDEAPRQGRRSAGGSQRWEEDDGFRSGTAIDHAQDSARMRIVPTGTAGTPAPSPHQAPRHGLDRWGMESGRDGADASARTGTSPCSSEGSTDR